MILPPNQVLTYPSLRPFLSLPLSFPLLFPSTKTPKFNSIRIKLNFSTKLEFSLNSSFSTSPIPQSDVSDEFSMELGRLLTLLPEEMRRRLDEHPEHRHLIEVVMDLGRRPLARFPSGDFVLSEYPITLDDLERATAMVGDFAVDNRAGISRTLHRISAIRNRKGAIIGLTCRVGRAVSGSANLLRDLVKDGGSLLLIGPPGVGKTTIIRDIARMLADDYKRRVMIVDTSNEIGGDGDIPHAGIGKARRMQVTYSDMQHKVLIEAVENHMPQVIVIDEIGTKLEAMAASTIAQRGIQLVATAHGITIENLIMNPSLEMLVGGVQSVTLGDEEASRRGVQKTVQERKGPSTFNSAVEIVSKNELRVHRNLEATVDDILSGRFPSFEVRKINQGPPDEIIGKQPFDHDSSDEINGIIVDDISEIEDEGSNLDDVINEDNMGGNFGQDPLKLFIYGISEISVIQGIKQLKMDNEIKLTDNISEADAFLALQSKMKKNSRIQAVARSHGLPIYVTKTSSLPQLTKAMKALMVDRADGLEDYFTEGKINVSEKMDALEEARIAIEQIVIPNGEPVELLPRPPNLLLLQKELIHKYHLRSRRVGVDPNVRLQILPFQSTRDLNGEKVDSDGEKFDDLIAPDPETNGSAFIVSRLPLLPG